MNVSTKTSLSAIAHKPMLTFWQQQVARFGDGFILKSLIPAESTGDRRALTIPFGKEVSAQIAKRCGNNPHALYICYLTTLSVVLRTYEDTPQVIIHSPLYGQEGKGELVYAETVPVGLSLNDECSLREHLRINQETIKQLFAYQQFPLATLRQNTTEALTSNVLFGTDTLHRSTSPATRQRYDFVIDMWVSEDGVVINYEFARNRFSDEFVRAFHRHWAAVLSYLDRPETPVRNISLLDEQAYKTIVDEFNCPNTSWSSDSEPTTIPALFERQAALTPDATAVIFNGQTLTYRQLNEASTQLAYLLQNEYQVGSEDRVGIMLDRSEWLIVSIWA